jgi:hypothetical protein
VNQNTAGSWKVERSALVKAINAGGRLFSGRLITGLSEKQILGAACRQAGLDAFGDQSFREPLRRLVESVEAEAMLNPLGRLATGHDLVRLLVNRLKMEEDLRQNPEIAAEEVRRPIIITGLPRTGTTLLHSLLAIDQTNRVPLTWETMYPSPPPESATYRTDRRIGMVDRQILWFHRMLKGFNRIHPVGATLPEECLLIFSHSLLSYQFETTHRAPSYLQWLEDQDLLPAYRMHRRVLQHLQWRCPAERWVLKAPAHMFDFEALFATYPDACVVMTHRDPVEVTASNASLTATLRSAFSDHVDPFEIGPECHRRWAGAIGKALRSRDRGCAPAERFLDLSYAELVADPVGSVRKVYARFDVAFPPGMEERIRLFLHQNPKDKFGKHRYRLEDFGLEPEEVKEEYKAYRDRFQL